ncbi:Uncharacterised protein g2455 [Pycnogonum litorale]
MAFKTSTSGYILFFLIAVTILSQTSTGSTIMQQIRCIHRVRIIINDCLHPSNNVTTSSVTECQKQRSLVEKFGNCKKSIHESGCSSIAEVLMKRFDRLISISKEKCP